MQKHISITFAFGYSKDLYNMKNYTITKNCQIILNQRRT